MKTKICLLCFLLIFPFMVNAESYATVVMDSDSNRVLYSEHKDERLLIASTTKIMTAIIAIENGKLDKKITVGEEIKEVYGSMAYLKVGDELTLEDLLYALMNRSGNDAAMIISHNIGGYDKFISLMNKKAIQLGMVNTSFENPHGLDDDTKNYSTAYDMALLMSYAIKNKTYREVSLNRKYKVETNLDIYIWHNKNDLLGLYKYTTAGKIGYTTKSRHVFVSAATKGKKNLVVSTIKVTDRFNDHKILYEKYFEGYDRYQILNKYNFVLDEDYYKKYHLYIKNDFHMLLKKAEIDSISFNVVLKKKRKVKSNDNVGYVSIKVGKDEIHREKIYAIAEKSKSKTVKDILTFWK